MLLNARVEQILGEDDVCGCFGVVSDDTVTAARLAVRRFLCKSVFVANTEVVWFEVGMFIVVCCSMAVNVIAVNRYEETRIPYDEQLQGFHYTTLMLFVVEVRLAQVPVVA